MNETDISLAKNLFEQGTLSLTEGDFVAAERLLSKAHEILPNRVSILINLLIALSNQKKLVEQERFLTAGMNVAPFNPEFWLIRGIYYLDKQNLELALDSFEITLDLDRSNVRAQNYKNQIIIGLETNSQLYKSLEREFQAFQHIEKSEISQALVKLNESEHLGPARTIIKARIATLLNELKRFEQAKAKFDEIRKVRSLIPLEALRASFAENRLGNYSEASKLIAAVSQHKFSNQEDAIEYISVSALEKHSLGKSTLALEELKPNIHQVNTGVGLIQTLLIILREIEQPEFAEKEIDELLAKLPDNAELIYLCVDALNDIGLNKKALDIIERNSAVFDDGDRAILKASVLLNNKKLSLSREIYLSLLKSRPRNAVILNNIGLLELEAGNFTDSDHYLSQALEVDSDNCDIYANLSLLHLKKHNYEKANDLISRAIKLDPKCGRYYGYKAEALIGQRFFAQAEQAYRQAILFDPKNPELHTNFGLFLLRQGALKEGFKEFEWRKKTKALKNTLIDPGVPYLSELNRAFGKSVLVLHEQGYGDTIQFMRFLSVLKRVCNSRVVFLTQPKLGSILSNTFSDINIVDKIDGGEKFDFAIHLLSIPYLLLEYLGHLPDCASRLIPPAYTRSHWSAKLKAIKKPLIGVAWSGNSAHANDTNRSIRFDLVEKLFLHNERASFVSLQTSSPPRTTKNLVTLCSELEDFSDTASVADCCDLVITVDTSVAHLSAALNKDTWLLLPYTPDFRWGWDGDKSPLYKTIRIFRQQTPGDWEEVLQAVQKTLDERYMLRTRTQFEL